MTCKWGPDINIGVEKGRVGDSHDFGALYITSFDTYLSILTRITQHIYIPSPRVWRLETEHASPHFRCTARSNGLCGTARPPGKRITGRTLMAQRCRPTAERKRLGAGLGPALAVPTGHYHAIHSDVILALTHPSPASRAPVLPFAKRGSVESCSPFDVGNVGTRNVEFLSLSFFSSVPGLNGEDLAVRDDRANCGAGC